MALPRLNELPEYEMVIPSTKKTVKFRPFLVKEQKVLLMAFESKETKQILNAISNTIEACIDDVDTTELANFDIDYMFAQIRAKSVGESAKVVLPCEECEHKNNVQVNLDQAKLTSEPKDNIVKISDAISIRMKYPTYHDIKNNLIVLNQDSTATGIALETIKMSLHSVLTEEEAILIKDEPAEEVDRFIESLTADQFEKLTDFIKDVPKLELDIDYDCEGCGKHNSRKVTGLEDFFF